MLKKRHAAFGFALLLAGCVSFYKDVSPDIPAATLIFAKGYEYKFPDGGTQVYALAGEATCSDQKRAAVLGAISGDTRVSRVPSDRLLVVIGLTTFFQSSITAAGNELDVSTCNNAASFTPQTGHSYGVKQHAVIRGECRLLIVDNATGAPPPSLRVVDHPGCVAQ
jgi:hypothetical protein